MKLLCHTDLIMEVSREMVAKSGEVYEARTLPNGDIRIFNDYGKEHFFSTNNDEDDYRHWFEKISPLNRKPSKPTIIELPNGHKIVINKPYSIYTDGIVTGKAKCNPKDTWNTELGIQIAVVRFRSNKLLNLLLSVSNKEEQE